MTSSTELYWQATTHAIDLAWDVTIDRTLIPIGHIERLLDVEPELLGRVLVNIAVAEMLLVAEAASLDLRKEPVLKVLLTPLDAFTVVPAIGPAGADEFAKCLWRVIQRQDNTTGDLVINASFATAPSPPAMVLNSAVAVIENLLQKVIALQPLFRPGASSRPFDQRAAGSQTTDAVAAVRQRLGAWLSAG
jgi:hypothetical protein